MFPYLDLAGLKRRTTMPAGDVSYIEQDSPGYTASQIALASSWVNGRLRKRYGNSGAGNQPGGGHLKVTTPGNSLPFGQTCPLVLAAGTSPPGAQLSGVPTVGSIQFYATVPTPGALGTATLSVSYDGGVSFSSPVVTALAMPLLYGMTLNFGPGVVFSADNVYSAATPVPEIVLGWVTTLVTLQLYRKRGMNATDPFIDSLVKDVERVRDEIKEAADSKDGLFDLPVSEDLDSAVTTGGPLSFADASPYGWQDRQAERGYTQDSNDLWPSWLGGPIGQ